MIVDGSPTVPAPHRTDGRRVLDALLTPPRAQLLLLLDEQPTMSAVAAALVLTPSSATYQVDRLVAAGLAGRVRDGSIVRVRRSALGTALIDLCVRGDGHAVADVPSARTGAGARPPTARP